MYCRSCRAKQATGVADLEAYRANPERFELVKQHAAYREAMKWTPRLSAGAELAQPIMMLLLAIAWSGGMTAVVWWMDVSFRWAFLAIAIGMSAVASVQVVAAARRLGAAPERMIAIVVEDVARPARGGDPAGVANHRVTLRMSDGRTRDVLATDAQMGLVALADIGVAYVQGSRLVDFRRFDVMPAPLGPGEVAAPPACGGCAAPYTFESRETCAYCGAALAHPELGEHGARFARVLAAPETAGLRRRAYVPELPSVVGATVLIAIAGVVLYGMWVLRFLWFLLAEEWPWGLLVLVPAIGIVMIAAIYGRRRWAPRLARRADEVALVVREREDTWATVNDRPVTAYFVTIAGPGGGRVELRAMRSIARAVHAGDMGVAHRRGAWLAGWTPIDPPARPL